MKKQSLVVAVSILLFACGGNAENTNSTETATENSVLEKNSREDLSEEKNEERIEAILAEEITLEVIEEEKLEEKVTDGNLLKEKVKETIKETVVEIVEEKKPVVVEVVRAKHDAWNLIAKSNVSSSGKVNYKGMKAELNKISTYLDHLKNTAPKSDWSKNEKLAYWINLYNASTVYLIASNYPITSITKLNGGKPWDKKFVKSGDKTYSLNDIENNIVRPQFKDPRIHAALNCAAVSCPKMLNGAFLPSKLSVQLDKQCRAWINDVNRNEITPNKLKVSQIFDWYKVDFKAGGGVVAFISKYNNTKILIDPKAKISYLEYNWTLNE